MFLFPLDQSQGLFYAAALIISAIAISIFFKHIVWYGYLKRHSHKLRSFLLEHQGKILVWESIMSLPRGTIITIAIKGSFNVCRYDVTVKIGDDVTSVMTEVPAKYPPGMYQKGFFILASLRCLPAPA